MIRNPAEYVRALTRLEEEGKKLAEDRARLKAAGLTEMDIENFLGPLETIHEQLRDEIEEYARFLPPSVSTPDISSSTTVTTRPKGKNMPRRKGMKKFGPGSSSAPKKPAGKETRRKFSLEDKAQILAEIDAAPFGTKGKVVEKHKLHSAMIAGWRKAVGKLVSTVGGTKNQRGRPIGSTASRSAVSLDTDNLLDIVKENSALRAEVANLRSKADQVKRFVAIQKQLAEQMLGAGE